jgi:two-component system nitrogen regulation sensor histidine kinase NtrY
VSFRTRLLLIVGSSVAAAAICGAWILLVTTTGAFERLDEERRQDLVDQFTRQFQSRSQETARRIHAIAQADTSARMVVDLASPEADSSAYFNAAAQLAAAQSLDFLDIVASDGRIISSAHWPARFGYLHRWGPRLASLDGQPAFLSRQEESADKYCIAINAVEAVKVGDLRLYLVGGDRIDQELLSALALPSGFRVFLYRHLDPQSADRPLLTPAGEIPESARLTEIVNQVLGTGRALTETVQWSNRATEDETIHAIPLKGREGDLLGVFLVGSSRREITELSRVIAAMGFVAGLGGILLGLITGAWATRRVTKPVQQLVEGARKVARGHWDTRVHVYSSDEIGDLAQAFNHMTEQLIDQRDRLVQAERVAAWRELARRLAHELKNPLFPLQITIENLQRAKACCPEDFDEVFREGTGAILAELANLKTIIGRFSEFAKMPQPEFRPVQLNQLVTQVAQLFEPQLQPSRQPPVELRVELAPEIPMIQADPEQLARVAQNLILNALDAMPQGGGLTVRTKAQNDGLWLEVEDSGAGLTDEEKERVFTPYYTTKQHGTGLGLAIVQAIISDHKGRILVDSQPGRGATFRIWLPR